ncbi:MAG: Uma2 family endonuclease [Cyanobacteria bacterium P01_F01_bin.4]
MGIYYAPSEPAIVPDGFLSLGVERLVKPPQGRLSYVFWEESNIPPVLTLEVVSKTYGREYEAKQRKYAEIGILYYLIYSVGYHPRRQRYPFEMYKLVDGQYERLPEDHRVWMPEVGLAIGRERDTHQGWTREWLYWYDQAGNRLLTPEEFAAQERQIAAQERQVAEQDRQRAERLAAKLRELGESLTTIITMPTTQGFRLFIEAKLF